MHNNRQSFFPVRVAAVEILDVLQSVEESPVQITVVLKSSGDATAANSILSASAMQPAALRTLPTTQVQAAEESLLEAAALAVEQLCHQSLNVSHYETSIISDCQTRCLVVLENGDSGAKRRVGIGRAIGPDELTALVIALVRAANHAGLLARQYRANNQKLLRQWAEETTLQLEQLRTDGSATDISRLLTESVLLESFNRVASAAVITAVNHPRPDSILSLFDTSAWLFDSRGQRRDSYTDTDLWLAWYPGVRNDDLTVDEVIKTMPAAPDVAIPWIVKLFENPNSRLRFRGAVDLEDHDVLHVLLGRGLQDQDEAFVLGFAMGTAKKISRIETCVFKFILSKLYPEPYRIPGFLIPAFDLGVECGRETGRPLLYKKQLKELRTQTLAEARRNAGIDMEVVKRYYQTEQERIPYTIASLRLP